VRAGKSSAEIVEEAIHSALAALRDGVITRHKAEIIVRATSTLESEEAKAAEDKVLDRAGALTPPALRAAITRAVIQVAPGKAQKRREHEAKKTRVERWAEGSGNAGLAGRELPPAQVLAADQRVTAWAKELRKAGVEGGMDLLTELRAGVGLVSGQVRIWVASVCRHGHWRRSAAGVVRFGGAAVRLG